jgi:hypothetical protein
MGQRGTTYPSRPPFIVDPGSVIRNLGRQVDWSRLTPNYRPGGVNVVVASPGAAIGATSIPVVALPDDIEVGELLNFGALAPVVATVGVAGAAQGATSVPVAALTGPIPSGTILDFGGAKFAVLTANAATGATALTVRALPTALVSADAATFRGGTKAARLTAPAAQGATTVTVDELQFALAADETAYFLADPEFGQGTTDKFVPAGTVMAETAEGKGIPRALATGTGTEVATYIQETGASENSPSDALTGYGAIKGAVVWENMLPDASGSPKKLPDAWKTELAAAGCFFTYEQYADNR